MAQLLDIAQACTALTALLASTMTDAYTEKVDVREGSGGDFDDQGQLVLRKVAMRVRFGQAEYGESRDITRTTLSASLLYEVICRHESLRSGAEMRNRTLQLVGVAQQQLAGARLLLANGTTSEPLLLRNVLPVADKFGPVEDCYAITVEVGGFAQFAGVNANPVTPPTGGTA